LSFVLLVLPGIWFLLREYQKQRIFSFLNPYADPLGTGYNVIQSTIAVGSGQLFGRGLGRGTQSRLQFLPEYHTDFIFATLAEELGFFGSILLLFLFFFLIFHVFETARSAPNTFGVFIAIGVGAMILFQVCVNVGMNIGIIPITGITLPLVSYGGSSLLATLISLGLVASVFCKKRQDQALRLQ
ncbi:MAG TPA: FtsW/RodA/SpoVE family cell cycle protein, partial [Patescibacteria group bacterium]|nr:FtsW/RodA/SpoVE family cell cycle protein [Patescibacteria group bacterium]